MIALIDADSLFYLACYLLDDPTNIEKCGLSGKDADTINESLAEIGADRLENMINELLLDITTDENNIEISAVEIYVTHCKNSIRKEISKEYKANRKPNPIVNALRKMYIQKNHAIYSDTLEADDLIAIRAKELGEFNCIIATMDKDLTQIGGFIYNFYRKPSVKDEEGNAIEVFKRKGLSYTNKFQAQKFLAKQMIQGDSGDRVQGLPKYGAVKAEKIVEPITNTFGLIKAVVREYKKVYGEDYIEPLQLNFRLLYLGSY
jgi:rRNA-processing protein FCF1